MWSIPNIGTVCVGLDTVRIHSVVSQKKLQRSLPIIALKAAAHSFAIRKYRGPHPTIKSELVVVCASNNLPLQILAANAPALGKHWVVSAEIAADVDTGTFEEAETKLFRLIGTQRKLRHRQGCLCLYDDQKQNRPRAGHLRLPTVYFDDRKCALHLKIYARQRKLQARQFGGYLMRIEWTIRRRRALERHIGGNRLSDLLNANLLHFFLHNFRHEQVDYVKLGQLTFPRTVANEERASRGAHLLLRTFAYRDAKKYGGFERAQAVWNSPSQLRGYLRNKAKGKVKRRVGRPKHVAAIQRSPITPYRIEQCFVRKGLRYRL